jgi:hypothetical protein
MKALPLFFAAALLTGCQPEPAPPPPADDSSRALERAVQEPLDKARAVEGQLKDGREKQDQEIEEGGG